MTGKPRKGVTTIGSLGSSSDWRNPLARAAVTKLTQRAAIDLVDEAASKLRMEIDSMPVELDEIEAPPEPTASDLDYGSGIVSDAESREDLAVEGAEEAVDAVAGIPEDPVNAPFGEAGEDVVGNKLGHGGAPSQSVP